jgi:hypothetical protein
MSFNLAWFAVHGIDPEDFLELAGFEDTGEADEYFDAPHSCGELPDGWFVLVTDKADLADAARLAKWSAGGRLIACVILEDQSTSLSMEWRDGKQVWSVYWDGAAEHKQLQVEGKLPDSFEAIHADIANLQAEADKARTDGARTDGDEEGETDLVFELPLDLAEEITGFRHDQLGFDDDIPVFNVLEPIHFEET